jgi:hypothetical protein
MKNEAMTIKASVNLPGIEISIIDERPQERLLLSIYEVRVNADIHSKTSTNHVVTDQDIRLSIKHM